MSYVYAIIYEHNIEYENTHTCFIKAFEAEEDAIKTLERIIVGKNLALNTKVEQKDNWISENWISMRAIEIPQGYKTKWKKISNKRYELSSGINHFVIEIIEVPFQKEERKV